MEYLRTTYYYIPPSQSVYAALCDLYQTSRVILKPPYNYTVDVNNKLLQRDCLSATSEIVRVSKSGEVKLEL